MCATRGSKADPARWDDWFSEPGSEKYRIVLAALEDYATDKASPPVPNYYFTPHDHTHCKAVEKMAKALVRKSAIRLTEMERFILFACVWTHDLGMMRKVAEQYAETYSPEQIREDHEKISAMAIADDDAFAKAFTDNGIPEDLFRTFMHTMNIINRFHRRKYAIADCPKQRYIGENTISTRLLACVVRMADTLHIDSSRYNRDVYDILQIGNFDVTARLHWLKSYVVSSVHLDIDRQTIVVTLDLPDPDDDTVEWDKNAPSLKSIISQSVLEDVLVVGDTFKEHEVPFYGQVEVRIDYCPGFEREKRAEIVSILNDLDTLMSPNTTRVMEKALDSIAALTAMKFRDYAVFRNQTQQLITHLERILSTRRCHVGLGRIIGMLRDEFAEFPETGGPADIEPLKRSIRNQVTKIRRDRRAAIARIHKQAPHVLRNVKNVLLFGYSDTVSQFLASAGKPFLDSARLYVFECGGKRRLSSTNSVEYNDGLRYATQLSSLGFRHITILPDTSFTSLLEDASRGVDGSNTVFLIGANGIDAADGSCGHSSGHLLLSMAANSAKIPVKVIADAFKRGTIDWKPGRPREGSTWLTGEREILDQLKASGIELLNYREDRIPARLFELVTDDKPRRPIPSVARVRPRPPSSG